MADKLISLVPGGPANLAAVSALTAQAGGNAGLLWDRYLPLWTESYARTDRLREPLRDFAQNFNSRRNERETALQIRASRFSAAIDRLVEPANVDGNKSDQTTRRRWQAPVLRLEYVLTWRFASGLGGKHPVDNDFTFDAVTGVPVIAGAAVKGLCRASALLTGSITSREIARLFGPEHVGSGGESGQGWVCFFDAFPQRWPSLGVDIVNSHHPAYYGANTRGARKSAKSDAPQPRETDDPNPVFFLAVEAGARFLFPVLLRDASDAETIGKLLRDGLTKFGIGAKTAVGYGVFRLAERQVQRTERGRETRGSPNRAR